MCAALVLTMLISGDDGGWKMVDLALKAIAVPSVAVTAPAAKLDMSDVLTSYDAAVSVAERTGREILACVACPEFVVREQKLNAAARDWVFLVLDKPTSRFAMGVHRFKADVNSPIESKPASKVKTSHESTRSSWSCVDGTCTLTNTASSSNSCQYGTCGRVDAQPAAMDYYGRGRKTKIGKGRNTRAVRGGRSCPTCG